MAQSISILGSTGSIGTQTLDCARNLGLKVVGLSAYSNINLLEQQAREFSPAVVAVEDKDAAAVLAQRLSDTAIEVLKGPEAYERVASLEEADTVVSAIVGIAGLIPTMAGIRAGKNIALANKETLVTAGSLVMKEAAGKGVDILPVDSEHAAVFQCLLGNDNQAVSRIILTGSGGPFRGKDRAELESVTVEQALKHPNWSMGSKITIDSATLMNKGLEVIEAHWLFRLPLKQIQVVIHPQSIIHSMVEYRDGTVMAQLGAPDMRIPIQLALTYPARIENKFSRLNLLECGPLTFEEPDTRAFPCLKLAMEALKAGGTMPAVLNAANEKAVDLFLKRKIRFNDIPNVIENVIQQHIVNIHPSLYDIIEVDNWARKTVEGLFQT